MAHTVCSHCGYGNTGHEDYCRNCGALLIAAADPEADSPPPDRASVSDAGPADPPSPSIPGGQASPADPETSLGLGQLAGLIPERSQLHGHLYPETAIPPSASADADPVPSDLTPLTLEAAAPGVQPREHGADMPLRRQRWLPWLVLAAALIPFWLRPEVRERTVPAWEGVAEARRQLAALAPGSRVLVYWQNEPAVAGELDLAAVPALRQLLAAGSELHVLTQHPLGLPHWHTVLDAIQADLQDTLGPLGHRVHVLGFWPGGYAVLPHAEARWPSPGPDLQLIVTPHMADVLHWLELIAPFVDAPVVVITSAGTGQVIRPYLDTGQVAGLVSGYDGAYQFTRSGESPVAAAYDARMARHFAAQNWITACLVLIILIAILFRGPVASP